MKRSIAIQRAGALLVVGAMATWALPADAQRRPRRTPPQTPAAEDPSVVEARRAYDDGRRLFEARSYAESLRRFERAYELRSNPVILVAIANCHEQLGNFRDAVASLERYLRDRADATDRVEIEARLAQLRPRAQQQTAAGAGRTATGAATTGGTAASATTASTATTTAAGSTATAGTTATAGAGASTSDAAANTAAAPAADTTTPAADTAAPAPEPAPPPPPRGTSPAVWVCAALAGAGVAGGSVLGFLALGEHATYNTAPSREVKDRGETYALLADLSFATAVLSGFVGTVVFLSDRAEAEREQRATQAMSPAARSRWLSRTRVRPSPLGVSVHW